MKGQIFIISSLMVLLALFLIRSSTQTETISKSDQLYWDFANLKGELERTVDLALVNGEGVNGRLNDFIDFSKGVYATKGYVESVNYTVSPGATTAVIINVSLSEGGSYLSDSLIVSRTVYT